MSDLQKKIYELSTLDLAKLNAVRVAEQCASDVAALRICIREAYGKRTNDYQPYARVAEAVANDAD